MIEPFWNQKIVFSRGENLFVWHKLGLKMTTFRRTSNAFKNGVLMLRNISTPFLNAYMRLILERYLIRYFCPFLATLKSAKPLFYSVLLPCQGSFADPPNRAPAYFPDHNKITNMNFVNKGGELFVGKKSDETPIL